MITTNRKLLARVCAVVLTRSGLSDAWNESGPQNADLTPAIGLTSSQRVIVEFVRTLWSGRGPLTVSELILEAEDEPMMFLGTLLVAAAYGEQGLSDWLSTNEGSDLQRPFAADCASTRH